MDAKDFPRMPPSAQALETLQDVCPGFYITDAGECAVCGYVSYLNPDHRCAECAWDFVKKIHSIGIIATPWGLAEARRTGLTDR